MSVTVAERVESLDGVGVPELLGVEGLVRRFGPRTAVDGVSFSIRRGEVVGLLGPNGAGKSTTFQVLASLLKAHGGTLRFDGVEVGFSDRRVRARMGVLFQKPSLDDQLTARENLTLGARLYGLSTAQCRERVEAMLELIGLADRGDEKVKGWSGGMKRRLELARALVHEPELLLIDEPTQGLDEASFRRFWTHVRALVRSRGLTVLLTTHRPEEAELCDRLGVLHGGRLIAMESPAALIAQVGGDIITLEGTAPEELAQQIRDRLKIPARVLEGKVLVEQQQGHALIPRLVEIFPAGRLASVTLRRPSVADVFLKLTGELLGEDRPAAVAKKERKR